jgi:glyoxylase-like metal-dependent hydrolase (beta-lactamase superfamily II)
MTEEVTEKIWFRQVLAGPMQNFVYLIGDPATREAVIVDAAWDVGALVDLAEKEGYRITHALVTHSHPDHVGGQFSGMEIQGVAELLARQPVKIVIHKSEADFLSRFTGASASDLIRSDAGDLLRVGGVEIKLLHTPGHTPGSQCFLVDKRLVSGDTLFIGSCGRVDLPGSDPEAMYRSLHETLLRLEDDVVLYPGHHYADRPSTTMGEEKRENMFLRFRSVQEFLRFMGPGA